MARRKRTRRRPYKKRNFKKSNRYSLSSVNKTNPFPKKFTTKLRYESHFRVNPSLGSTDKWVFRASDVFDPDYTGGGHQPRYFDQIMPLYNHFTVIGSKITVKAVNDQNASFVVGIQLNANGSYPATICDLIEQKNSRYAWVGHQYSNSAMKSISMSYSPKKFLGIPSPLTSDELRGTIASTPDEGAYFAVVCASHDPLIELGYIQLRATIDYIVVFTEPKVVAMS